MLTGISDIGPHPLGCGTVEAPHPSGCCVCIVNRRRRIRVGSQGVFKTPCRHRGWRRLNATNHGGGPRPKSLLLLFLFPNQQSGGKGRVGELKNLHYLKLSCGPITGSKFLHQEWLPAPKSSILRMVKVLPLSPLYFYPADL